MARHGTARHPRAFQNDDRHLYEHLGFPSIRSHFKFIVFVHHLLVVCGRSSILFSQTYSQTSNVCLWMELGLSVAHLTCIRPLRSELDDMNTYFSIIIWSSVDAARSQFLHTCYHILFCCFCIGGCAIGHCAGGWSVQLPVTTCSPGVHDTCFGSGG